MGGVSQGHQAVLEELCEWWTDLCMRGIRSRTVLVEVPPGWGRTTFLLDQFAAIIKGDEAPVTLLVRVSKDWLRDLPGGRAGQVRLLADVLANAAP